MKEKKHFLLLGAIALCAVIVGVTAMLCLDPCVRITAPEKVVYLYHEQARQYLTTGKRIVNFVKADSTEPAVAVVFSWECREKATEFRVEYATDRSFRNAVSVTTSENSISVYNLYKATKYYLRVTAYSNGKKLGTDTASFKTADLGPRVIRIDGLDNVRDVGGYHTESGKTTLQGLVYRGSEMNGVHDIALTEAGDAVMSGLLGIAHDMDLREPSESGGVEKSPISSASLTYYPLGAYMSAFNEDKDMYRQVFAALAAPENYPVYIHCWGGADRTGTVCFLLNALLGVSEEEMIQDYEFTSFSAFGIRDAQASIYAFKCFLEELKTYEGDTLSAKTESYLLSIGLEQWQIDNIRGIMFGQIPIGQEQ